MPTSHFSVGLVEDDPRMRERLAAAVIGNPQLALVYCGGSSRDCIARLSDHPVQVLLVDLERDLARHVLDLRAGGSPMSPFIARRLLQVWHSGSASAAPSPVPQRAEGAPGPLAGVPAAPGLPDTLTPREAEVLALVARGFIYDEVAARMGLSVATVRTHVRSIYGKLDAHNKTEAVFEARALGWLD